jgi:hypothetical protein
VPDKAEKGVPDWGIRAQFGHVSAAMMAVYSHIRQKALDQSVQALQPDVLLQRADQSYDRVSLSVSVLNPAVRLYERLGFASTAVDGASMIMTRSRR